jgi:hypothetical protein
MHRFYRSTITTLSLLFLGCSTDVATHSKTPTLPTLRHIKEAALNAATQKRVWVPLAGALIMSIDNFDEDTSKWATEKTPLFGSQDNANDFSNNLNKALALSAVASALMTSNDNNLTSQITHKGQTLGLELSIYEVNSGLSRVLKRASGRDRPDNIKDDSSPATHATEAFTAATLTQRNLQATTLSDSQKKWSTIALDSSAYLVSWARIESNKHYPSDVLFGAALGNFMSAFMYDSFMEEKDDSLNIKIIPTYDGLTLELQKEI